MRKFQFDLFLFMWSCNCYYNKYKWSCISYYIICMIASLNARNSDNLLKQTPFNCSRSLLFNSLESNGVLISPALWNVCPHDRPLQLFVLKTLYTQSLSSRFSEKVHYDWFILIIQGFIYLEKSRKFSCENKEDGVVKIFDSGDNALSSTCNESSKD